MEEETKKELAKNLSKLTDLVVDPVKQRTAHPFVSSYLISWFFVNWKAFSCLLLSSKGIEDKIKYIDTILYADESSKAFSILIPLLIAFIYTIGLKWLDTAIDLINNIPINYRIKNQAIIKVNTLDAEIDIVEAQIRLNNARAENKELQELNEKISHLSKEIELKDQTLHESQLEIYRLTESNTEINKEVHKLKIDNSQLVVELSNNSHLKNNMESLLKTMVLELEKDVLLEILQKTMPDDIPENFIQLAEEAYEEKNNAKTHAYRIELKETSLEFDLKQMKANFSSISKEIGIMLFLEEKEDKVIKVLEITYPNYISEKRIKSVVNKYLPL